MARLCTEMSTLLQGSTLKRLHQRKIFTVIDILQENPDSLVQITKLSYKEVLQIRQSIIANYSAFPRKGIDAYNELVSNTALIPTGIENLDSLIEGGFMTGKVYEICGSSGTGKTQFCLTVSTHIAHNFKQQVHYIDTKRDFSGKRVHEMLDSKGCSDEDIGNAMERIKVTRLQDIYELFSFMQHLKNSLHHEQDGHHSVRLIILDSLPVLFFPFLGKNLNDGLGLMNQFANTMNYIAAEYHITFLVVNLAVQWLEEEAVIVDGNGERLPQEGNSICDTMKPALGKYWLAVPCTRLFIHKVDTSEKRQMAVMRSTYLTTRKFCDVSINSKGIVSA